MSDNTFFLKAESRKDIGKGASRRLRHENKIPAVVYGGGGEATSITISHFHILKCLNDNAFYSQIIDIEIDGEVTETILRDLQRHPYKPSILHADFQRIVRGQEITVNVPLLFTNTETSVGVKAGGIVNQHIIDVEISARPSSLPSEIEVNVADLDIGDSVRLAEIILPEGVSIPSLVNIGEDANVAVVSISMPKGPATEDEAEVVAAADVPVEGETKPEGE